MIWNTIIAALALLLSAVNFWYSFLRRARPVFVCSRWTAVGMQGADGRPRAAFAVQISVINRGRKPLELTDFVLVADTEQGKRVFYEPLFLWDLRQYIEDSGRQDRIGRAQKGQVPLPILVPPDEYYDFGYPALFLPIDVQTLIQPQTDAPLSLRLYALTNRSKGYQLIDTQVFEAESLANLGHGDISAARSSASVRKRSEFVHKVMQRRS